MSANKEVVENVRQKFLKEFEANRDLYHQNDISHIRENDWPIERHVLVTNTEEKALKAVIKSMRWRKSFGVHRFNDQYFPQEIHRIGEIFQFGRDKDGRPVVWFIAKNHYKSAELGSVVRQFIVYEFEKVDRQVSHQGWCVVCDSNHSGLSNVDMDCSRFMIDVIESYYPRAIKYMCVVDLPWILNATAKILVAFMGEELKNSVKFIKQQELTNYLNPHIIPVHMGGNCDKRMNEIPEDCIKKLDQMPNLGLSGKQIEKAYAQHLKRA